MANAVKTPSQNNLMTEGSIVKSLLLFALPLIFGNLLQQLYNTADSIIVGNFVGANALAAVGSSGSPIYLLIGFSQGLAVGAGVVVSQFLGAKDHREAQEAVHTSLAIAVIMGLLLTVGGIACGRALLVAMNTPAEVLGDAVTYIRIYFGGVLFSVVYNMTAGILNAAGNSRRSLIYLAWASVTNIVLDLVFIVIFRMGVAGAAIATVFSQVVSAGMVTVALLRQPEETRLSLKKIRFQGGLLKRILYVGVPAGLQFVTFDLANLLIQSGINSFGSVVMAGSSAASGIENFIHTALNTFYQSAITFTGQSMGASDPRRAVRVFRINLALTTGLGIVLCALAQIFQIPLLGLYVQSTDPAYDAVIAAGVVRVLALSRFQWVGGLMETACGTLRGLGHSMNPTVTTLIGACLLRVVWRYTVFEAVGTVESMYWSYPVSWLLTFLIHLIYLERDRRRLMAENTAAQ